MENTLKEFKKIVNEQLDRLTRYTNICTFANINDAETFEEFYAIIDDILYELRNYARDLLKCIDIFENIN